MQLFFFFGLCLLALGAAFKTAFLAIDPQKDFSEKNGALLVNGGAEVMQHLNAVQQLFDEGYIYTSMDSHPARHVSFASTHRVPVFTVVNDLLIQGTDKKVTQVAWPDHCVIGTQGQEFHNDYDSSRSLIIMKGTDKRIDSYSAFGDELGGQVEDTGLNQLLQAQGVTKVVVAGLATDYCVYYTALDALRLNYEVMVYLPACRGVSPDTTADAIASMKSKGVVFANTLEEVQAFIN
jgi:nicotinamidase/pyrazinamidase